MEDNAFTRRMQNFYPDKEIFEIFYNLDNWKSCVYIIQYEEQEVVDAIIDPQKLLIKEETISIKFSYPLKNKVNFEYTNKGGFTRMDLFRCIYEGYKQIYETEEEDAGDPGTYDRLYNRRPSEGRYRIWGHYITDLRIEGIVYDSKTKLVELLIGS